MARESPTGADPVGRLELPVFDGANPEGWIFRVGRYFESHQMTEVEKIEATTISMHGRRSLGVVPVGGWAASNADVGGDQG